MKNRPNKGVSEIGASLSYNKEINAARDARDNQILDTDPRVQKEGYLGVDNLDKMRRNKLKLNNDSKI